MSDERTLYLNAIFFGVFFSAVVATALLGWQLASLMGGYMFFAYSAFPVANIIRHRLTTDPPEEE